MWADIRTLLNALLIVGIATVSAPVLLFGGFLAFRVGGEYLARTEFHAAAWKSAAGAHAAPREANRVRMVDDLLDRHDLKGMTRSEVAALLGESDDASIRGGEPAYPGWDLVYYLGPDRGLGLDSEFLALRLGEEQRVSEFGIIVR